jgi:hypothetical protein
MGKYGLGNSAPLALREEEEEEEEEEQKERKLKLQIRSSTCIVANPIFAAS